MSGNELSKKSCKACRGDLPALSELESRKLLSELQAGWQIIENHHLEKEWPFSNFQKALDFVNLVGALAENEGHHPDVFLAWGRVQLTIWTHKKNGLTESDFIFAAKCDEL